MCQDTDEEDWNPNRSVRIMMRRVGDESNGYFWHLSDPLSIEDKVSLAEDLVFAFVNARGVDGNAALHLSVLHCKKDAIEWLLVEKPVEEGEGFKEAKGRGRVSLTMLNKDNLTPLCLSAAPRSPPTALPATLPAAVAVILASPQPASCRRWPGSRAPCVLTYYYYYMYGRL